MKLFPYQIEGVALLNEILTKRNAAVLADDMGLGKTAQALEVTKNARRVLILSPASVVGVWETEIEQFYSGSELRISATIESQKAIISKNEPYIISSYDMAIRRPILKQLVNQEWDFVIYDEAHNALGNRESLRCRVSLANLPKVSKKRLFLTGSVTANKIINLWPMYRHCAPDKIPKYWPFAHNYCHVQSNRFGQKVMGGKNLEKLNKTARSFIVRRLKEDVLPDLPEKLYQKVWLHVPEIEADINLQAARDFTEEELECDDPPPEVSTALRELGFKKVKAVTDYLINLKESDEDDRPVVFCNHTAVFQNLIENLANAGYDVGGIEGATSQKERKELIAEFQAGDLDFFVCTSAASEGVTLTRSRTFVSAEMFWRLSTNEQAIDRLHRIGQKHTVNVKWLLVKGTYDENLYRSYQQKKRLKERAIN